MTNDVLRLSRPNGKDDTVNTLADNLASDKHALAYNNEKIARLEKINADLKKANQLKDELEASKSHSTKAKPPPAPVGKTRHVAHATSEQKAVCTAPDICKVGKDLVAFDSYATLEQKKKAAPNVKAQGTEVYRKGDLIKGVKADAGKHVTAGTSQGSGHVKILEGHNSVKVGPDKLPIARHDSKCLVNCDANGNGGTTGKLVTEQKSVGGAPASQASNPNAPPGQRTSPQLERLKDAKTKIESGQLDFNALDEYVNFKDANKSLDDLIGQIKGTPGSASDYAAQATRGLLGFGKDIVTGVGELAYEGIKGVPKLVRSAYTSQGQALNQLKGQILAENIRLGNITPDTVGQGALDIGAAIVKPITDPWKRGDYVESVTRGAAEAITAPIAWTKAQRAAQAAKAKAALEAAEAAKAKAALEAAEAAKAKAALEAEEAAKAGDGVHVKAKPPQKLTPEQQAVFDEQYKKAPAAKEEIDKLSKDIAAENGGKVAEAPIKSSERAIEKVADDYNGDATKIKDLARNTIVVPEENIGRVTSRLEASGADIKVVDAATDPMGYSGVKTTVPTQSGLTAEIQVNSPAMIYAKESSANARSILGNDVYDSIARQTGTPGGRGHELYEQWRVIPDKTSPQAQQLAAESRQYYDTIRRTSRGN